MQLAHWLICEARIFTSSMMFGSRLPAISIERLIHFFMRVGATAKGSSLGVMVDILCFGLRHQDEAAFARVTCLCSMERFFPPGGLPAGLEKCRQAPMSEGRGKRKDHCNGKEHDLPVVRQ